MTRDREDALVAHAGVAAADLSELLALISASNVVELDVTVGATRLSLRRPAGLSTDVVFSAAEDARSDALTLAVTSPLVGVFRTSLEVGAEVEAGQPIGAVEALGLATNVDAPHAGTVE